MQFGDALDSEDSEDDSDEDQDNGDEGTQGQGEGIINISGASKARRFCFPPIGRSLYPAGGKVSNRSKSGFLSIDHRISIFAFFLQGKAY